MINSEHIIKYQVIFNLKVKSFEQGLYYVFIYKFFKLNVKKKSKNEL